MRTNLNKKYLVGFMLSLCLSTLVEDSSFAQGRGTGMTAPTTRPTAPSGRRTGRTRTRARRNDELFASIPATAIASEDLAGVYANPANLSLAVVEGHRQFGAVISNQSGYRVLCNIEGSATFSASSDGHPISFTGCHIDSIALNSGIRSQISIPDGVSLGAACPIPSGSHLNSLQVTAVNCSVSHNEEGIEGAEAGGQALPQGYREGAPFNPALSDD